MIWILVALFSILITAMLVMEDIPLSLGYDQEPFTESYTTQDITAPAASGLLFRILFTVIFQTPLKTFYIRNALHKSGIGRIRQLVAELSAHSPLIPTHFPIHRLSPKEHDYHVGKARDLDPTALLQPISVLGTPRSVAEYHKVYQSGAATPSQVVERLLIGCQELQHLRIFRSFNATDIRRQAAASTERWKRGEVQSVFDGVPVAFKDMVGMEGHILCRGSQHCTLAQNDDRLVARFRKGGAILLGTTVMTEGGVTPMGYSLWSDGPFNPYDTDYYSGGSSSGSAVVVASGLAPVAIGFDGGGSIRVPASMSGVVGLATTFGRVPYDLWDGNSMVKAGPLAATVHDAALAYVFMSNREEGETDEMFTKLYDGGNRGVPPPHLDKYASGVSGMRLGVFWDHFVHTDPEVLEHARATVQHLEDAGAAIVNITIPYLREMQLAHGSKILAEFAVTWDAKYFDRVTPLEMNTMITLAMGKVVSGNELLASDKLRTWAIQYFQEVIFGASPGMNVDAVLSPTLGTKVPKPKPGYRQTGESNTPLVYQVMRFVTLANFMGLPAISVPVGYEKATGLPVGFQVMGDAWSEHSLLRVTSVIETISWKRKLPSNYFDPLQPWTPGRGTQATTKT